MSDHIPGLAVSYSKVEGKSRDKHIRLQPKLIDRGRGQCDGHGYHPYDLCVSIRVPSLLLVLRARDLRPEVSDDKYDSVAAGLEVLTPPFGKRRLHADAELPFHRVVRPGGRNMRVRVTIGCPGIGLIARTGAHGCRWQW
jgi:hypothetical protein